MTSAHLTPWKLPSYCTLVISGSLAGGFWGNDWEARTRARCRTSGTGRQSGHKKARAGNAYAGATTERREGKVGLEKRYRVRVSFVLSLEKFNGIA